MSRKSSSISPETRIKRPQITRSADGSLKCRLTDRQCIIRYRKAAKIIETCYNCPPNRAPAQVFAGSYLQDFRQKATSVVPTISEISGKVSNSHFAFPEMRVIYSHGTVAGVCQLTNNPCIASPEIEPVVIPGLPLYFRVGEFDLFFTCADCPDKPFL